MQELLQLPLQVQATLVAGYLGYTILKRDHRKTEKITDVSMLILVLGLPTALLIQFCKSPWIYLTVLIGPTIAIIWTKGLERLWTTMLHNQHISHRINEGDVWKTLSSDKSVTVTQIKVFHENGNCYCCHDTSEFDRLPFAPFIMDEDGIAFYVTDTFDKMTDQWIASSDVTLDNDSGSMITYFPREDVKRLEMRCKKPLQTNLLT
ncbi:MAG: hypothetical protein Q4P13_12040 [Psychrobacter sp.]|nr:hypothetical protein [Psychrobacter sp.]